MMKKIINFMLLVFFAAVLFANEKTGERSPVRSASETNPRVVASTSWTAAFADIFVKYDAGRTTAVCPSSKLVYCENSRFVIHIRICLIHLFSSCNR